MSNKLGFIGCGEMAKAIIKGILNSNYLTKDELIASTKSESSAKSAYEELKINVITDNKQVVQFANIIFIAAKPAQVEDILEEIKEVIGKKLIVSIAAGINTKKIENITKTAPVIRVMPNTPALLKEGMSATAKGLYATNEDENIVHQILSKVGKVISVDEKDMDTVTAISGSGPAFFYKIFEDIANAGTKLGLDYEKSLLLTLQTAIGSAKMALNRESSMKNLIESVTTKGGCTEVGINTMKESNIDNLLDNVIKNTANKAHLLG